MENGHVWSVTREFGSTLVSEPLQRTSGGKAAHREPPMAVPNGNNSYRELRYLHGSSSKQEQHLCYCLTRHCSSQQSPITVTILSKQAGRWFPSKLLAGKPV